MEDNKHSDTYSKQEVMSDTAGCRVCVCVQVVLPCLLDLLLVLETPPSSLSPSSSRRKPSHHDDVLRLVLTHMEAEHKVALRHVYASALPPYIDR